LYVYAKGLEIEYAMAMRLTKETQIYNLFPVVHFHHVSMCLESAQRVGVGNDTAAVAHDRRCDRGVGESSPLLVVRKSIWAIEVLVDDTGHAVLAVAAHGLGAVIPERLSILDNNLEDVGLVKLSAYVSG